MQREDEGTTAGELDIDTVPDLSAMPREAWKDALRPLDRWGRKRALRTVGALLDEPHTHASMLVRELEIEAAERRIPPSPRLPPAPDLPGADAAGRERRRQVNFRLGPGEHDDLLRAAATVGLRPAQFARLMTVRGAGATLRQLGE